MAEAAYDRARLHRKGVRLEWFTVSWNVIEAAIAIGAGIIAGSTALVAFGVDSLIEVISAVGLLWRFLRTGRTPVLRSTAIRSGARSTLCQRHFFCLPLMSPMKASSRLLNAKRRMALTVGLVLSILSLIIMPVLAYTKQKTGRELGSRALQADAVETWVCSSLSLALLIGVGLYQAFGWWWADAVGALLMLPVILWQGWETLGEAREEGESVVAD